MALFVEDNHILEKESIMFLLFWILHQFNEVVEENIAVAVAKTVDLVADFAGVVMNDETRLPRFEMLMAANARTKFL